MKPLSQRDPFRLGILAGVVGLVAAVGIVALSVASFGTREYTAVLQHTAGLRASEDVQVHGVSSGKVTDIKLEDQAVVVTFVLDQDIDLGADTTAAVKVATLLGTHYLQVEPEGSGSLPQGRIPLSRTTVPFNLQDVIEEGTAKLDELDPVALARALTAVSETLSASGDDIGPALEGVARLSAVVSRRSGEVGDLLRAARAVTDQLNDSSTDIVVLMEQTNLVVNEITSRRVAIRTLLRETTGLSQALTAVVEETKADLNPTLDDLNLALDALNRQDKSLQQVLTSMAPAVRYVANAAGNGPFVDLNTGGAVLPTDEQLCQLGNCP